MKAVNVDEVLKIIHKYGEYVFVTDYKIYTEMQDEIANLKAIEPEPKIGHWIGIDEEPHEDYECNNCGYVVSTYTANIEPHTEYKYCPNCGAKMQEVEK